MSITFESDMSSAENLDQQLLKHSLNLEEKIKAEIIEHGMIPFSKFMQMALYYPGLGYYSSGMKKFGESGDFVTSGELGNLFARCVSKQFAEILGTIENEVIVELGAGTGQFCFDSLLFLDEKTALPNNYYILEISADLRQRQEHKISQLPEHLRNIVSWLDEPLTEEFNGVIFANEVIDALPVEVFRQKQDGFERQFVSIENDNFAVSWSEMDDSLSLQLKEKDLRLSNGYTSEFIPNFGSWLNSISKNLKQGAMIFIDYGYERDAYYHEERSEGTLVCHHQHKANFDYFNRVGIQDITAFVDFTSLAESADSLGFDVSGYTTQSNFLLSLGIQDEIGDSEDDYERYFENVNQMKKLVLPNEMGEKFKVMALTKNIEDEFAGFTINNSLHLL